LRVETRHRQLTKIEAGGGMQGEPLKQRLEPIKVLGCRVCEEVESSREDTALDQDRPRFRHAQVTFSRAIPTLRGANNAGHVGSRRELQYRRQPLNPNSIPMTLLPDDLTRAAPLSP